MYVLPKLYGAGWTDEQINEQHTFTDGRVIPTAKRVRRGLQKRADYPPDSLDLIIVDECHRGSARDESSWREILEYFEPAYQLGLVAAASNFIQEEERPNWADRLDKFYTFA